MARPYYQNDIEQGNDPNDDLGYGGGGSVGITPPGSQSGGLEDLGMGEPPLPTVGGTGSTDGPRQVPGPGREDPTTPPDVRPRTPNNPPSEAGGDTSEDGGYTPTRPKAPAPAAMQPPQPFSPLPPMSGGDPAAMTSAMRAPFIPQPLSPEPLSQYGGDPGMGGLMGGGSAEGLMGGGMGLAGGEGFQDNAGGDPLDALIRILMQGQGGQ